MKLWPFTKERKQQQEEVLTNDDLQILNWMMYRFVNRDQVINRLVKMSDYITYGFAYNPTVYSVINFRSTAAKGIPWLLYRITDKRKAQTYAGMTQKHLNLKSAISLKQESMEEVTSHPINDILKKPNPAHSMADMVEAMFIYRDTTGNAYEYSILNPSTNEIIEQHYLPADKVRIVGNTWLNPVKGYTFDGVLGGALIPPDRVLHWKYFNPTFDQSGTTLYGMSPLVAAARIINNDNAAIDSMTAGFANEGVKTLITGTESEMEFTKEQAETVLKKWRTATKRAQEGGGNVQFNRAPVQVHKVGETPIDMGTMDARKFNKEILCNMFRMHPSLLSSDASTLNNMQEARKSLLTMSVMPDLDSYREHKNAMFQKIYGPEWFIDYDIMAISELQDDIEKIARTLSTLDMLTDNEKRNWINYEDYDHPLADVLWRGMSEIPMGGGMDTGFDRIDEEIEKRK